MFIMSQKTYEDKVKTMLNVTAKDEVYKNRKYDSKTEENLKKKLDENIELAFEMGVQGTPAMFDMQGNKIVWVDILKKYGIEVR